MNPFTYSSPTDLPSALDLLGKQWGRTEILAGGTDLLALSGIGEGARVTSPRREIRRMGPKTGRPIALRCPHNCGKPRTRANFGEILQRMP
jgi:hypothetical protein